MWDLTFSETETVVWGGSECSSSVSSTRGKFNESYTDEKYQEYPVQKPWANSTFDYGANAVAVEVLSSFPDDLSGIRSDGVPLNS